MSDSSYNMDDWDPMQESFNDASFNSYHTEAAPRLPRHKQSTNFRKEESPPAKLYVCPLSEEFTTDSLRNIFLKFGEVIEVYIHASYGWAFVKMRTLAAADKAIRNLNNDPKLKFKVKFAKEKSESVSVAASETGSSEINHGKRDDVMQSRSQFSDNSHQKSMSSSMAERSVPETSERLLPNFQFSKSLFPVLENKSKSKSSRPKSVIMNGDIAYQTVPNCCNCKCSTSDSCIKCGQPFCSLDCMVLGYKGHTDQCVRVPLLASQLKKSSTNPTNGVSSTTYQNFPDHNRNDLNHYEQPSDGVGNSGKSSYMNDLGAKYPKNGSQDVRNGRPATTANYKAFEKHENSDRYSRNSPSDNHKSAATDDTCIYFNIAKDDKRNTNAKRERDSKFNRSNEESESSWNNQASKYHSKTDNASSKDRIPGKRSNHENASSWGAQSSVSKRYPDSSKDTRSRESENGADDQNELWETQSQACGYNSKRETASCRDNRSRVGNDSNKENESVWDSRSSVSAYRSKKETNWSKDNRSRVSGDGASKDRESSWETKSLVGYRSKENDSPRDNQSRVSDSRANKKNKSSWETRSLVSAYHSKDNDVSRDNRSRVSENRLNKDNESWETRSHVSGYHSSRETSTKKYRSYETDSEQRSSEAKKFENSRKSDGGPSSPISMFNFNRDKPDLSSLFRAVIRENDKFEVKLAEDGPPAVLLVQEMDSLNSLIEILQAFPLKPINDISKLQKCAAKKTADDYGTWYRGLIVEDDPLVVKFIDFSYERVKVRREDLRIIPEKFLSIDPFCYPVKFMNASIDEVNELKNATFEVVFLSKEYGTWNVNLVKPCKEESKEIGKSDSRIKPENNHRTHTNLKVVLKKGVPVEVYVTYVETHSKKIFVTIHEKLCKLVNLIGDISPPLADLQDFRLNTICLALFEDSWYRAKIISVDPLEVYYIDFGNVEPAEKSDLKILPEEFQKIDPLAVPVKLRSGSKSSVSGEETVEIVPIEQSASERIWIVRTIDEPEILENPVPESSQQFGNKSYAPEVALDEIMEVQVTYTISNTEYYVGPKNMNELLEMGITDEEMKKLGPLKTPSVGTLCVKNFETLWSRAKIVELEPLRIYYIDFGNEEEARIEELYPLPEKYQRVPPVAFKIRLQEPKKLPEYVPLKMKKVSDNFWTVVDNS